MYQFNSFCTSFSV